MKILTADHSMLTTIKMSINLCKLGPTDSIN